jgi:DNA-binding Lrp family transcriptional regulator
MDDTDRALITLLRKDARTNVAAMLGIDGRWHLLAELQASSNAELSALLGRVCLIKGIANTETSILLATYR